MQFEILKLRRKKQKQHKTNQIKTKQKQIPYFRNVLLEEVWDSREEAN